MVGEVWAAGDAYEGYIGRWSRPVAAEFLRWLGRPAGLSWLDVGSGTGALSATIASVAQPARVLGVDSSAGFVAHARAAVGDPRVSFEVADARSLPVPDGSFDVAASGLVLNFVPEPERAVAELARAVVHGGLAAAYLWDYAGGMQLLRHFWDAAGDLDPAAVALDEGRRFPSLCSGEGLAAAWSGAGLTDVQTRLITVPTVFASFDDYWMPFLGGQGPAPGYVATLDPPGQAALREELRRRLPAQPDGTIALTAAAWAVRGTVA